MGVKVLSPYSDEPHEECGIVAIFSKKGVDVAPYIYRALVALQHRGQDAAGLAVYDGKAIEARRGIGLATSVFEGNDLLVRGRMGIGHTRYPTFGECRLCDVQPMVFRDCATAHNGHLANYPDLRAALEKDGFEFMSSVDSEVMAFMLSTSTSIEDAVRGMMGRLEGSYSVASISRGKLAVFRDPLALRPLVYGENDEFVCFASESVALDINGIPYKGDLRGGELAVIDGGRLRRTQIMPENARHCMFEYVYFSRPDSYIDGKSVYSARKRLGQRLARESPVNADLVVPVPDTSRTAAASFAAALGIPCEEGLIKNRYIGRTFIMPSQEKRADAVKLKLNPVRELVEGKSVVLIDDSIVRGTTLKEIVALTRQAGAGEIHLRITCPPLKAPCFYGVDMSSYSELIANKKTIDQIRMYLGADSLAYISLDGLRESIGLQICSSCLTGKYNSDYVGKMAQRVKRSEKAKRPESKK